MILRHEISTQFWCPGSAKHSASTWKFELNYTILPLACFSAIPHNSCSTEALWFQRAPHSPSSLPPLGNQKIVFSSTSLRTMKSISPSCSLLTNLQIFTVPCSFSLTTPHACDGYSNLHGSSTQTKTSIKAAKEFKCVSAQTAPQRHEETQLPAGIWLPFSRGQASAFSWQKGRENRAHPLHKSCPTMPHGIFMARTESRGRTWLDGHMRRVWLGDREWKWIDGCPANSPSLCSKPIPPPPPPNFAHFICFTDNHFFVPGFPSACKQNHIFIKNNSPSLSVHLF